ncbi:cysteine-tryptophan domain-containing zinc finger protein 3-like [Magnolia sinica]|uniref:cysteine-tryptophan domain-containing zinc finger protein 3-like n=1 Tax=Magnolia sinica TaxID=86752 RepID=UPI00265859C1|nr:cysteine-tryptophan domain-containing zinc finger protein 3-like [Magnolia sinica]
MTSLLLVGNGQIDIEKKHNNSFPSTQKVLENLKHGWSAPPIVWSIRSTNGESEVEFIVPYKCIISFERDGEIAAVALAYKCMEVAYMRVIFSMSLHIHRDSHKLQASLHGHPFGQESSPLAAIDVTNVREDVAPHESEVKGVKRLASRATCSGLHILNYAEYVSSAMDAAQRSLSALKAAQWKYGLQGIAAVKTALDFHFHDMDGFVRQVRLALEQIDF